MNRPEEKDDSWRAHRTPVTALDIAKASQVGDMEQQPYLGK
jgi:hypothetical protein